MEVIADLDPRLVGHEKPSTAENGASLKLVHLL
jgi:hypothetical protein